MFQTQKTSKRKTKPMPLPHRERHRLPISNRSIWTIWIYILLNHTHTFLTLYISFII